MLIAPFAFLLSWLVALLSPGLLAGGPALLWGWYSGAVVGLAAAVWLQVGLLGPLTPVTLAAGGALGGGALRPSYGEIPNAHRLRDAGR